MLEVLLISLAINTVGFLIAYSFRSDKLTDLSYAFSFIAILVYLVRTSEMSAVKWGVAVLITAWAVRLGGYLLMRIRKIGSDKRFDAIRDNFGKFAQFWIFQAVTVWIIMLAPTVLFETNRTTKFTTLVTIGLVLSLAGILIEAVADYQKFNFINRYRERWVDVGLWKFSRHPNYFGEILVWVGIYVMCVVWVAEREQWIALVSPLFISGMLLFVSGIPILEASADRRWGKDKKYQHYKSATSILIPLPRGKIK